MVFPEAVWAWFDKNLSGVELERFYMAFGRRRENDKLVQAHLRQGLPFYAAIVLLNRDCKEETYDEFIQSPMMWMSMRLCLEVFEFMKIKRYKRTREMFEKLITDLDELLPAEDYDGMYSKMFMNPSEKSFLNALELRAFGDKEKHIRKLVSEMMEEGHFPGQKIVNILARCDINYPLLPRLYAEQFEGFMMKLW